MLVCTDVNGVGNVVKFKNSFAPVADVGEPNLSTMSSMLRLLAEKVGADALNGGASAVAGRI
jgi:hypothetical protein